MAIPVRVRPVPKGIDYSVIGRSSPEIKQICLNLRDAHRIIQGAFDSIPVWRWFRRQRLLRISQYLVDYSMEIMVRAKREEEERGTWRG